MTPPIASTRPKSRRCVSTIRRLGNAPSQTDARTRSRRRLASPIRFAAGSLQRDGAGTPRLAEGCAARCAVDVGASSISIIRKLRVECCAGKMRQAQGVLLAESAECIAIWVGSTETCVSKRERPTPGEAAAGCRPSGAYCRIRDVLAEEEQRCAYACCFKASAVRSAESSSVPPTNWLAPMICGIALHEPGEGAAAREGDHEALPDETMTSSEYQANSPSAT